MFVSVIYDNSNVVVVAASLAVAGMMMMSSYGAENCVPVYPLLAGMPMMYGNKCKNMFHI
jgi:hypothetical protein